MSKRKLPNDNLIKKLYLENKLSSGQIAKKYNTSRVSVCKHLRRLDIVRPQSGENSRNRNYNIKIYRSGYPVTFKPTHPRSNHMGYVFDHILEWEKMWGMPKKGEPIHHIDLDRKNSKVKNLYQFKNSKQHQKGHKSLNDCVSELIKKGKIKFNAGRYFLL